jgi:Flp pilus assembly protein TadB
MADKFEREIEEILAKLDGDAPAPERTPISIKSARRKPPQKQPPRAPRSRSTPSINPTTLLFAGAGVMIGGLLLSAFWEPLIWASFAGIVLFLAAFLWSFRRSARGAGGATAPQGHYWRDRYIEYPPASPGVFDRMKRRFRRR